MQTNPLLSPRIQSHPADDLGRWEEGAALQASPASGHHHDRPFLSTYVLVTLLALLAGYVLGQLGEQPSTGSRVGWPPAPANPRSLNP
jgi:hypothetical protein